MGSGTAGGAGGGNCRGRLGGDTPGDIGSARGAVFRFLLPDSITSADRPGGLTIRGAGGVVGDAVLPEARIGLSF
jgi:hypothetical protein